MDDNSKQTSSYQLDQEILDARGIDMTVEDVAGLSTCKYSERVQLLKLSAEDLGFLKGLRRRIKNRLASQNSRRRSVEHLRRLARELRAVRACRDDALSERAALLTHRQALRRSCTALRRHIVQKLQERSDFTPVPTIDVKQTELESQNKNHIKKVTVTETKTPLLPECYEKPTPTDKTSQKNNNIIYEKSPLAVTPEKNVFDSEMLPEKKILEKPPEDKKTTDKNIFECRIDKLVQQSVNHIFKSEPTDNNKKKIFAKTVFISNDKLSSDIKSLVFDQDLLLNSDNGVLNLSLKEGRRKSHGRKQLAPRRIAYVYTDNTDGVLDLKIKKENQ